MQQGQVPGTICAASMQAVESALHPTYREPHSGATPHQPWWRGWGPMLLLPALVLLTVPPAWPRWALMWALAFAVYCGCKWLTWRRTPARGVPAWRHLAYLLAWPGLDASAFLQARAAPDRPAPREWLAAAGKLGLGLLLLFGVVPLVPDRLPYLAGWVGMVGIILTLHFGSFHLLSCVWRGAGVQASPLMDRPLAAAGVAEFWGRRWNKAFRDLTHRFLFRPLTARLGPRRAVLTGFLFSGLVHDLVISVPAGAGYGGPTLFFTLQGLAVLAERSRPGRRAALGRGWTGWWFTLLVLVVPVYALFHPPFVVGVVLPFLRALGGVS